MHATFSAMKKLNINKDQIQEIKRFAVLTDKYIILILVY